jgi:hypothetical protein
MPIKRLKSAKSSLISGLDVNGDGVVDHRDALVAAKIAGATAVGAGATALASASAGSMIIATGAAAVASKVAAISGAAAGAFLAVTLGSTTTAAFGIFHVGSTLIVASSSVTTAVGAKLAAAAAGSGALIGQAASGTIAGLPIIQKVSLANAVAANEVIVVAGIPMGVTAAIAAGVVAIVIIAGYAYYLLTKDRVNACDAIGDDPALT